MIYDFYGSYSSFFLSALLGIATGVIYDIFRILRISRTPHVAPSGRFYDFIKIPEMPFSVGERVKKAISLSSDVLVIAEDIVFWIIVSILHIFFIYHINDGEIRIYFFIFSFSGAVAYFFTVGKIVMYFAIRIIFLIRSLLYWSIYIIIYPIRQTLSILIKLVCLIYNKVIRPAAIKIRCQNELKYSEKRIAYIINGAKSGFLVYRSNENVKKQKKHNS